MRGSITEPERNGKTRCRPARDVQSPRAIQRLHTADVIFYGHVRDVDILELARRGAERICLSQVQDDSPWSQGWMVATLTKALKQGHKVVWITSKIELAQDVTDKSGTEAKFVPDLGTAPALQQRARRAG